MDFGEPTSSLTKNPKHTNQMTNLKRFFQQKQTSKNLIINHKTVNLHNIFLSGNNHKHSSTPVCIIWGINFRSIHERKTHLSIYYKQNINQTRVPTKDLQV